VTISNKNPERKDYTSVGNLALHWSSGYSSSVVLHST
jgi:hypothetical protein